MKKRALLFPLLVILSAFAVLYAGTAPTSSPILTVSPVQPVRMLAASIVAFCALAPLMNWLVRDWDLAGIFLGILAMALLYTAKVVQAVGGVLLLAVVLWWGYGFLLRRPARLQLLSALFSVVSAALLSAELWALAGQFRQLGLSEYFPRLPAVPEIDLHARSAKPDIYYIVVDAYGRADVLKDHYSFDNSQFIEYLQSRDFVVAAQAHSNYSKTALSVSSELNLEYADQLAPGLHDSPFWWTLAPYIDHSRLQSALEKLGYETYGTASDWGITDNEAVDHYYRPHALDLNEFEGYTFSVTLLGQLVAPISPIASMRSYDSHRDFIENGLASLPTIAAQPGPKLVFAHIAAPHPPFVYDAEGGPLNPAYPFSLNDADNFPGTQEEYRTQYIGQLRYLNNRLEQTIDGILANSLTPPVIVLHGDHGPRMLIGGDADPNTCVRERFSILAAIKMPGAEASAIPPDITPVNVFRIIMNQYFDTRLPLLPNASYAAEQVDVLHWSDVTARLEQRCTEQTKR